VKHILAIRATIRENLRETKNTPASIGPDQKGRHPEKKRKDSELNAKNIYLYAMSFAGHVFDMINRVKYNNDLKKAVRNRHRDIREAYISVGRKKGIPLKKLHEISEAELEQFRS
jgi:hypothetical protein